MMPLQAPCDWLTFQSAPKKGIFIQFQFSNKLNAPVFQKQKPGLKQNLVYQAAHLFYQSIGKPPKIKIHVQKEIPLGGGMGGGSSNAATTLLALNHLYQKPLKKEALLKLAKRLGSDVPFFIDQKSKIIHGTGDQFLVAPKIPIGWIVVLNPKDVISTVKAYQAWDKYAVSLTKKNQNVRNGTLFEQPKTWKNDFEKVVFPKKPRLQKAKNILLKEGASLAGLSGSGPTLYGLFRDKKSAIKALENFNPQKWIGWITKEYTSHGNYRS